MKLFNQQIMLLCITFLAVTQIGQAAFPATPKPTSDPIVTSVLLQQEVDDAITEAITTMNFTKLDQLGERGDTILPYLQNYLHDSSENKRQMAVIALGYMHSNKSLALLVPFIDSSQLPNTAFPSVYCHYTNAQLRSAGGVLLKKKLLEMIRDDKQNSSPLISTDSRNGDAIFLISVYKNDSSIIQALKIMHTRATAQSDLMEKKARLQLKATNGAGQDLRSDNHLISTMIHSAITLPVGFGSARALRTTVIDASLADLGDHEALKRVKAVLYGGNEEDVLFLLRVLPLMENKRLIGLLLELLKNKNILKSQIGRPIASKQTPRLHLASTSDDFPTNTLWRVCDIALLSLAVKTQNDVGIPDVNQIVRQHDIIERQRCEFPYNGCRRYTDQELTSASMRIKAYVAQH